MNINYPKLYKIADSNRINFSNEEFKRITISDFLGKENFEYIYKNFPSPEADLWKETNYEYTMKKSVSKKGVFGLKEELLNKNQRNILLELNSGMFIHFLERLSGITGLVPDPYFAEAGFHLSRETGSLEIHADFSHHDDLKLERRLNVIYYLNKNYDPSFGGALELYNKDLTPLEKILPYADTAVIFETNETSYHGFPDPMNFPANSYRRSIAMYYYTIPTTRKPHRIIFPRDKSFNYTTGHGSK